MPRDAEPRWFVDETSLGLGRALALVRGDVVHPGHRRLLEVPKSTPDLQWMPVVAERRLVVISRDRHIKTKDAELRAFVDHRIRAFWIAGDRDMGNWDNLRRVVKWWDTMERIANERSEGPWFYSMFQGTLTEVTVRARVRRPRPHVGTGVRVETREGQLDLGI